MEILKSALNSLLAGKEYHKAVDVFPEFSSFEVPDVYFATPDVPKDTVKYTHAEFQTKGYREESCAIYKVYKAFKYIVENNESFFLRVEPFIQEVVDYKTCIKKYIGYFRISMEVI